MKKRSVVIAAAMVTCTSFSFTSCGGSGGDQQQSAPDETSIETDDDTGNQPGVDMNSDTTGNTTDTTGTNP